jgi:hypothetical protein
VTGRRVAEVPLIATDRGWRARLPGERTRDLAAGILFGRVAGTSDAAVRLVVVR